MREIEVPRQDGKIIIVTGSNSGIGYEAARLLSGAGGHVIMACRNIEKAGISRDRIMMNDAGSKIEVMKLDLASLGSVKDFASEFREKYDRLDILVNNAGVMGTPYRTTEEGFEMQFGTNHLGHFALTGLLLDRILANSESRVVNITSIAHFNGQIHFDDINLKDSYGRMKAYRQSKLANLYFSYELQRRFSMNGFSNKSIAVHPGISSTSIIDLPPILDKFKDLILMSARKGALPTVMGATDPGLLGGEYIGPDGMRQAVGWPSVLESSQESKDPGIALRLWELSEEMTGITYKFSNNEE